MGRFLIQNSGAKTPWNTGYINKSRTAVQRDFDCIYCETDKAVLVTLEKKEKLGLLHCRKCGKGWKCSITPHLDCELDVYANWVDTCGEAAKREIEEEDKLRAERMEWKEKEKEEEKARTEAPKPVIRKRHLDTDATLPPAKKTKIAARPIKRIGTKRKLETDGPEPVTKKRKPNYIPPEKKPTSNLTKTPSRKPASAKPPPTSLPKDDHSLPELSVQGLIERHRIGKKDAVRTEAQKIAAAAKERRRLKGIEWARIAEEIRVRKELFFTTVAIATATKAKAMMKKRLEGSLIDSSSKVKFTYKLYRARNVIAENEVAAAVISKKKRDSLDSLFGSSPEQEQPVEPQPKEEEVVAVITKAKTDDFCETLSGSFSNRESATNILDVPTPMGSPELSPSYIEEQPIPTIKVEFVKTSEAMENIEEAYDALFGGSSDEVSSSINGRRRDSSNSLFGDLNEDMVDYE